MRKALSLVSILMLISGAITLAVGVMNVSLFSSAGSGVMTNALIGLTVVLFILGGALDLIGGRWAGGPRSTPTRRAAPSSSACWP